MVVNCATCNFRLAPQRLCSIYKAGAFCVWLLLDTMGTKTKNFLPRITVQLYLPQSRHHIDTCSVTFNLEDSDDFTTCRSC